MTADEEAAYVREVASQKTAALRMSLDAVERQGMPFVGETGGVGAGQGMGEVPAGRRPATPRQSIAPARSWPGLATRDPARSGARSAGSRRRDGRGSHPSTTQPPYHAGTTRTRRRATRRAPRPERLQR